MQQEVQARKGLLGREWQSYRRLLAYTRPYLPRLAVGIVVGLVYAASQTSLLWVARKGLGNIYKTGISTSVIILYALLFPMIGVIRGVSDYISNYLIRWVGARIVMDLRNLTFRKLNDLPLAYFVGSRTGELISRTTNDTTMIEGSVSTAIETIAKEPANVLLLIGTLIYLDPLLALVGVVLFPVCILPVAIFGRRVRRFAREAQQRIADVVSIMQEMLTGVRVVKAFGMEEYENRRFYDQTKGFFSRTMRVARAQFAVDPMIVFISTCGLALALLYVHRRGMPIENFIAYAGALVMLYEPVKKLSRLHLQIQQASAAADRVFEILDAPPDIREKPGAQSLPLPVENIAFEDVHFSYGDKRVLAGVSFTVRAGQRIAIVGSSGAGKTTLVNLLPRFYDVTGGAVRINGCDIRDCTIKSLRLSMSIVTQDTILFNDTVANNISYGTADADREAVVRAARLANAHEFIVAMPSGYDTVVGEHGMRLSGGQRQRLAIARAALRNPPIMILDEATSALDTESERLVQAALLDLMRGRTVFAIAHRLSTLVSCDRIIVIDDGRIAEDGTHAQLLERGGLYRRLYDLQFQEAGAPASAG